MNSRCEALQPRSQSLSFPIRKRGMETPPTQGGPKMQGRHQGPAQTTPRLLVPGGGSGGRGAGDAFTTWKPPAGERPPGPGRGTSPAVAPPLAEQLEEEQDLPQGSRICRRPRLDRIPWNCLEISHFPRRRESSRPPGQCGRLAALRRVWLRVGVDGAGESHASLSLEPGGQRGPGRQDPELAGLEMQNSGHTSALLSQSDQVSRFDLQVQV